MVNVDPSIAVRGKQAPGQARGKAQGGGQQPSPPGVRLPAQLASDVNDHILIVNVYL
jgi:hypothetical protein